MVKTVLNVFMDGPSLQSKYGITTVVKLRLKYKPPQVNYLLNVKRLNYFSIPYYFSHKLLVHKIFSGISSMFHMGFLSKVYIFNKNIDLVHSYSVIRQYNYPTVYELDHPNRMVLFLFKYSN